MKSRIQRKTRTSKKSKWITPLKHTHTKKQRAAKPIAFTKLAKQFQPTSPTLPPGARLVTTLPPPKEVPIHEWQALCDQVMSIPIYIILCHSALCVSYARCGHPDKEGDPFFVLGENTYILNATAGGVSCMTSTATAPYAKAISQELRKVLLIDSPQDAIDKRTKRSSFPFLLTIHRASNITYPNILCTFHDEEEEKADSMFRGVFHLDENDTFSSKESILDIHERDTWYLEDIIQTVYAKTKTTAGIFLFTGCTTEYTPAKKLANLNGPIGKAITVPQERIYIAEQSYRTIKPTLDVEEIEKIDPSRIPVEYGIPRSIEQPGAIDLAGMIRAGYTMPGLKKEHPEIYKELRLSKQHEDR